MVNLIGQTLGNYYVLSHLKKGGMANIFLAEHKTLGKRVAIKVLDLIRSTQDINAFLREAKIIALSDHPHIVEVWDYDEFNGIPYLVMKFYPKGSLRDRYTPKTVLTLDTIVMHLNQIASALQFAHDRKIIHRDLKPENLLVTTNDDIVLSDFGIAVAAHTAQSLTTQAFAGTAPYMPPEQWDNKAVRASDQYALGIILYAWLAGELPFTGSLVDLAIKHRSQLPPPLSTKNNVSPEIEQIVMRSLAKDPKQRFPSVADLAKAFEDAVVALQAPTIIQQPSAPPKVSPGRVFSAALGNANPYGSSGTLTVDSDKNDIWLLPTQADLKSTTGWVIAEYKNGTASVHSSQSWSIWMKQPVILDNFACQVMLHKTRFTGNDNGLIFRANGSHTRYYRLVHDLASGSGWGFSLLIVDHQTEVELGRFEYKGDYNTEYEQQILLGVVANGSLIEIYENLTLIGSVDDTAQLEGEIGLFAHHLYKAEFSKFKAWKLP